MKAIPCPAFPDLSALRWSLPLQRPMTLADGTRHEWREGVLITDGNVLADAAPLRGFSTESLSDVIRSLGAGTPPPPSLQFALDCIRESKTDAKPPIRLAVNGLWIPTNESKQDLIRRVKDSGVSVLKVKVAPDGLEELSRDLREIAQALPSIFFRLDANRRLSKEQLLWLLERLPMSQIDYIEEPLSHPSAYADPDLQHVPLALDESLLDAGWQSLASPKSVRVCIVKPTLLGPLEKLWAIADWCSKHKRRLVFTHCFESGPGLAMIAGLAHKLAPNDVHGLDCSYLADFGIRPQPHIEEGQLHISQWDLATD